MSCANLRPPDSKSYRISEPHAYMLALQRFQGNLEGKVKQHNYICIEGPQRKKIIFFLFSIICFSNEKKWFKNGVNIFFKNYPIEKG